MSTRIFSDDKDWNEYGQWFVQNGGFIHDALGFSPASSVVYLAVVYRGAVVKSVPMLNAIQNLQPAIAAFPKEFIKSVTPHAALCFLVAKEHTRGEQSFWWPYLRILPKEFNTPLYFDDADKAFLNGCNLGYDEVIEGRRSAWSEEWSQGVKILEIAGESVDGYSWDLFLWAATIFTSRSFPERLMSWDDPHSSPLHDYQNDTPALFPLLDGLNHQPRARITWQPGPDALTFVSVDTLEPETEVFNNYGPKANEELLLGYGFTIPDNPSDTMTLRFSVPLSPPQEHIRSQQPQPTSPGIYHLFLDGPFYPKELTRLFHILTASPTEFSLLQKTPSVDSISIRNSLATQSQLLLAMRRKLGGFNVDPGEPQNDRQRAAKTLRDGQIKILEAAIRHSEHELESIFSQHAGREILTLSAVLQERVLAEAIRECFGTDDVSELVESEQEDIVFVLFLCWKFLTAKDPKWTEWFEYMGKHYPVPNVGQDEEVDEEIQATFESIFPAAASAAPSIFGGAGWTPALLGWVIGIYQQEGVSAVLAGALVYIVSLEVHVP